MTAEYKDRHIEPLKHYRELHKVFMSYDKNYWPDSPQPSIESTIEYVQSKYKLPEGKYKSDQSGNPAINHPIRVASFLNILVRGNKEGVGNFLERFQKEKNKHLVALLHDIVEDKYATQRDLRKLGYSEDVIKSVEILTKEKPKGQESFEEKVASY
jgi:(p)ppGpp synthase/HD superfamily hydrolase